MQSVERSLLRALAAAGVPLAGARVLDVGCGTGYFLHRLRDYGAGECHGIDLLEERVAEGRERYPALELQVGNAAELPFADGEFDLVTQFTCLSSILDDDVRLAAAQEMRRVARRRGPLVRPTRPRAPRTDAGRPGHCRARRAPSYAGSSASLPCCGALRFASNSRSFSVVTGPWRRRWPRCRRCGVT